MLAKEPGGASSSCHEEPVGDDQPMLDQHMGDDVLLHVIDCLHDGVLAFALVCTAFRGAVYCHMGSVYIRSTCAQVVPSSKPDAIHPCTSVSTN